MHYPTLVCGVERSAGLETDNQCLGWLEQATAVEDIAEASPAQILNNPEDRRFTFELSVSPTENGRNIGVRQRCGNFGLSAKRLTESISIGELWTNDLDGYRPVVLNVNGLDDDRVGARRDNVRDAVPVSENAPFKAVRSAAVLF